MRKPASCARARPSHVPPLGQHAPMLRALADEARLEIVARLAASGTAVCVCDLTDGLGLAAGTISHHLKVLREGGVVRSERRGTWVYYWLEPSLLGALASLLVALAPKPPAHATVRAEAS